MKCLDMNLMIEDTIVQVHYTRVGSVRALCYISICDVAVMHPYTKKVFNPPYERFDEDIFSSRIVDSIR